MTIPRAGSPPQVDYRLNPSAGNEESGNGETAVPPCPDASWKSYDAVEDAMRFNGINSPEQQARLLNDRPPGGRP